MRPRCSWRQQTTGLWPFLLMAKCTCLQGSRCSAATDSVQQGAASANDSPVAVVCGPGPKLRRLCRPYRRSQIHLHQLRELDHLCDMRVFGTASASRQIKQGKFWHSRNKPHVHGGNAARHVNRNFTFEWTRRVLHVKVL